MATGDKDDMLRRLRGVLPRWWPDNAPILDAILSAFATVSVFVYDLIQYAILQTRIKTATGGWLDLIAFDFFGLRFQRPNGMSDTNWRTKILIELFRERATRNAITLVLRDLTGKDPIIFEPQRPLDTGGYNTNSLGYGVAGGYGSLMLPYQAFVTAFRPEGSGIPYVAGYGVPTGAYSTPSRAQWSSLGMIEGYVTDQDIYDAVESVRPAGTILWVRVYADPASLIRLVTDQGDYLVDGNGNFLVA